MITQRLQRPSWWYGDWYLYDPFNTPNSISSISLSSSFLSSSALFLCLDSSSGWLVGRYVYWSWSMRVAMLFFSRVETLCVYKSFIRMTWSPIMLTKRTDSPRACCQDDDEDRCVSMSSGYSLTYSIRAPSTWKNDSIEPQPRHCVIWTYLLLFAANKYSISSLGLLSLRFKYGVFASTNGGSTIIRF